MIIRWIYVVFYFQRVHNESLQHSAEGFFYASNRCGAIEGTTECTKYAEKGSFWAWSGVMQRENKNRSKSSHVAGFRELIYEFLANKVKEHSSSGFFNSAEPEMLELAEGLH